MVQRNNIKIYQNCIDENDLQLIDPSFFPNDISANPLPELRETHVFIDYLTSGKYKSADYVGIFSKKFNGKTKVSGEQFINFIQDNPGYDVYFINPYPQNAYFSYNIWQQGEFFHPGIIKATQTLFDFANVPIDLSKHQRHDNKSLLYCNYWVGNARFWETYAPFLQKLFLSITQEMPEEMRKIFFSPVPYADLFGGELKTYVIFPFIFERLFSTFLLSQTNIKYLAYTHSNEEIRNACLNDMEYRVYLAFNSIIDNWDAEKKNDIQTYQTFQGLLSLTWQSVKKFCLTEPNTA